MGDNLHDCLKREASLLSLNSHCLVSVATDKSAHIYPFSLHGMKSEEGVGVLVGVGDSPKLKSQISDVF